jgi:hypothetical protein
MEPIMADHMKLPYLRLVTSPPTGRPTPKPKTQLDLVMDREPNVLGLFWLAPERMRQFVRAIDATRPRYVFDLRVLPSFDGAGLTRRSMFRLARMNERMDALEQRLMVEFARHTQAISESLSTQIAVIEDKYAGLPPRETRLETKVFASRRRRSPGSRA